MTVSVTLGLGLIWKDHLQPVREVCPEANITLFALILNFLKNCLLMTMVLFLIQAALYDFSSRFACEFSDISPLINNGIISFCIFM